MDSLGIRYGRYPTLPGSPAARIKLTLVFMEDGKRLGREINELLKARGFRVLRIRRNDVERHPHKVKELLMKAWRERGVVEGYPASVP